MWRWTAVWQLSTFFLVAAIIDFGFFSQKQHPQVDCFTVPMSLERFGRSFNGGWRSRKKLDKITMSSTNYPMSPSLNSIGVMSRRLDRLLLPGSNEIVREHAKLVQDINSLKQVVFISPLVDEVRDYDDSIFHDQIETSTTPRSSLVKPKPIKNHSIPIILLGGESQNEPVQTQPVRYPKPIKLVGTSVSPLVKHPYPFVLSAKSQRPFKVCMQPLSLMYPTTRRPGLLQRIINSIIPR